MNRHERRGSEKRGRLTQRVLSKAEMPIGMLFHCTGRMKYPNCAGTLMLPLDTLSDTNMLRAHLTANRWILTENAWIPEGSGGQRGSVVVCEHCAFARAGEGSPTSLWLQCPGKHGKGCGETIAVPLDSLWPFKKLDPILTSGGWSLATGSCAGQEIVDPLCGRCTGQVLELDSVEMEEA